MLRGALIPAATPGSQPVPGCACSMESPRQLSLCLHVNNWAFCLQRLCMSPFCLLQWRHPISSSDTTLQPPSWCWVLHPQPTVHTLPAVLHPGLNWTSIHSGPACIIRWPCSLTERQPLPPPDLCACLYLFVFACLGSSSGAWLSLHLQCSPWLSVSFTHSIFLEPQEFWPWCGPYIKHR